MSLSSTTKQLAWPKGAKKSKYKNPGGAPTPEFKKAMGTTFTREELKDRSDNFKSGASSAVFAAVCIRESEVDKKFPGPISEQWDHVRTSSKWDEISYNFNDSKLKAGDVIFLRHKDSSKDPDNKGPHFVTIYIGNEKVAQASSSYFGRVKKLSIEKSNEEWVRVFRPKESSSSSSSSSNSKGKYKGTLPKLPPKTAKIAVECAYPYGTKQSKYKYSTGSRKPEYSKYLNKAWPDRSHWHYAKSKAGASCDVFVGVVLKNAGYKNSPHAMAHFVGWCRKNLSNIGEKSHKPENGDILTRENHIMVCVHLEGKRRVANAHFLDHGGTYGIIENMVSYNSSSHARTGYHNIWRPTGVSYFSKGDKFTEVKRLKKFLNWYGGYNLTINYDFDKKTEKAVKDFQKKEGLNVTGRFGKACLKKAQKVSQNQGGMDLSDGPGGSESDSSSGSGSYGEDTGGAIVLENEIAKLFSSDNYKWASGEVEETEEQKSLKEKQSSLKAYLSSISVSDSLFNNAAPLDTVVSYTSLKSTKESRFKLDRFKTTTSTQKLISYPNLVEAPTIELTFNGITIGGYNNRGDKYPNYIDSMTVSKINGRINTYTINLVYQIRANEDPNFIDKLLSNTGYTRPLKIKYGDANSPGLVYKEESAIITDVKSRDSVSSSSINYTIQAISSVTSADKSYYVFKETTGKPSTIINELLYDSGQISNQLLTAFPSMQNRTFVNSNNLIPNNDSQVTIGGMSDVSPLTYLSHAVSCMQNISNTVSSYFLTYGNSSNGAYFKISEVSSVMDNNALYEVDVGYPGDNFVTRFELCDNIYWPLVYEYNGKIPKWDYNINDVGKIIATQSNALYSDNKFLKKSIINENWWKSITEFPISAKLTLKGLAIPVMLMTYIRINTLFYGQKDIASGIYVVTDQNDSVSKSGYSTTLTLLRVSE